jgi:hypothetical protein
MGAEVVRPLRETFVVQQQHEEEGPKHTDGIVGGPPAWAGGVERTEHGPGRVQIEPEEHEGGLVPGLRQAARLAAEPALELGR